jgi:hypothetical protein
MELSMSVATQISGNIHPNNSAFKALITMLMQLDVTVEHSPKNKPSFYDTELQLAWQHYNNQLSVYESIAESTFHIVYNDGPIDDEIGSQILYAILKNRPVVMTGAPIFSKDINPFVRETIIEHLHHFHSILLTELELDELDSLLKQLKATDYHLSNSKRILIHAHVKMYFRDLLQIAKEVQALPESSL